MLVRNLLWLVYYLVLNIITCGQSKSLNENGLPPTPDKPLANDSQQRPQIYPHHYHRHHNDHHHQKVKSRLARSTDVKADNSITNVTNLYECVGTSCFKITSFQIIMSDNACEDQFLEIKYKDKDGNDKTGFLPDVSTNSFEIRREQVINEKCITIKQ